MLFASLGWVDLGSLETVARLLLQNIRLGPHLTHMTPPPFFLSRRPLLKKSLIISNVQTNVQTSPDSFLHLLNEFLHLLNVDLHLG